VGLIDGVAYAEDVRHATMFLDGKSEQVIDELVARMESASKTLDFEAAARYRDQIVSVRRVQERQYISGAHGDVDVVALAVGEGLAAVQVFYIRDGQSLGNKSYFPRNTGGADNAEIMGAFLSQYYLSGPSDRSIPAEIIVSEPAADLDTLARVLSERAGRRTNITCNVRGDRARWLRMARSNAGIALAQRVVDRASMQERLQSLQEAFDLDDAPARIECFDVSHSHGEAPVASCVVFEAGGPLKSDYRKFNINDVSPGDDYGAMRQALHRRYTRLRKEDAKLPDVLLVDGGKGQLSEASAVLEELQVTDVLIVAVAKGASRKPGLEVLHLSDRESPVSLEPDSPALHLIQQIRDEAHRFAIAGHRSRRNRARRTSPLEDIPGIGAKRRQRLLTEFGGLQGISRAGVEDLGRVRGISPDLAQAIYDRFRDDP
jgi:excinuclease ABC subunit C